MLINEINRIKSIMGLITEDELSNTQTQVINNENDYINLLKNNGFKLAIAKDQEEINRFFSPSKVTLNQYKWLYINSETKVYTYKGIPGNDVTLSRRPIYSPKEDKTYTYPIKVVTFPVNNELIKEYITEPKKIDQTYDLNSIVTLINKVRDVWGSGNLKIVDNNYQLNNNGNWSVLNKEYVDLITRASKSNLDKAKNLLPTIPSDELTTPVKSSSGESYANINDYINKVESEAKELKLI